MRDSRLSEMLGGLSLATDLSAGQPTGSALCAAVLAQRIGQGMGLSPEELKTLYYASITRFIGCTASAHDVAPHALGDELSGNLAFTMGDALNPEDIKFYLEKYFATDQPDEARQPLIDFYSQIGEDIFGGGYAHCEQAVALTKRLPLPGGVPDILASLEARWDGRNPCQGGGEDLSLATRIIEFCVVIELHRRAGGLRSMVEVANSRSGGQFDPKICAHFIEYAPHLIAGLGRGRDWDLYVEAEPGEPLLVGPDGLRDVAMAYADFTDNKSPWFLGHSRKVAGLAFRAAESAGIDEDPATDLFNAALLHDVGKTAIPNGIWEKSEPLNPQEEAQARTCSFHTEQILATSPVFEPIRELACSANERADGSGYHRHIHLRQRRAAMLAAANLYDELTSDQPWRPAHPPGEAAEALLAEATAGRLPSAETRAVLDGAGHARGLADKVYPDGLTRREAEVLEQMARGLSTKEIARKLGISPKTADNHTQNLYKKIGASSRTAAAMYALERGIFSF